ncbi:hypothetical protein V6Z79_008559 [Aspergillus fumigatus]
MNPTVLGTDTSRHRLDPPKVQSEIQIRKDTSQDMRDTRLARNSQSIRIRPPDQHHLRPERQRFGDIRTRPHPGPPESNSTSNRSPTASTISGSTSSDLMAPSCCRPP